MTLEELGNRLVDIYTNYAMELTVEDLIEKLQEVNDKHKKVYLEGLTELYMTPVTGIEEKHYGIVIIC